MTIWFLLTIYGNILKLPETSPGFSRRCWKKKNCEGVALTDLIARQKRLCTSFQALSWLLCLWYSSLPHIKRTISCFEMIWFSVNFNEFSVIPWHRIAFDVVFIYLQGFITSSLYSVEYLHLCEFRSFESTIRTKFWQIILYFITPFD